MLLLIYNRINSIAIFPVFGLSTAVSILAGCAQGAKHPYISSKRMEEGAFSGGIIYSIFWQLPIFFFYIDII